MANVGRFLDRFSSGLVFLSFFKLRTRILLSRPDVGVGLLPSGYHSRAALLLAGMAEAIDAYLPSLREQLNCLPDGQAKPKYSMADLVFAVVVMFLLKATSRNSFNESRRKDRFSEAFLAIFKYRIPHMDTAHSIVEKITPEHLEGVSIALVKTLLKRGTLHPLRLLSDHHVVSIDGVQVTSLSQPAEGTTWKEPKNGVKTFLRSYIQARIMAANGFAIPMLTEWIESTDGATKQICELNVFKRLAVKLQRIFPRLSICFVGDALYANDTVFSLCAAYGWKFIVTFKDKLKSVHAKIDDGKADVLYPMADLVPPSADDGGPMPDHVEVANAATHRLGTLYCRLQWLNSVPYRDHELSWLACADGTLEGKSLNERVYYAWLMNIKLTENRILSVERAARLACSGIEDAFNTSKNWCDAMTHKFARKSFNAAKNYLLCMHIAEALNQLVVLRKWARQHILDTSKATMKALWIDVTFELHVFRIINLPALLSQVPQNHCYQ